MPYVRSVSASSLRFIFFLVIFNILILNSDINDIIKNLGYLIIVQKFMLNYCTLQIKKKEKKRKERGERIK